MGWNPLTRAVNKFLLSGYWSPGICQGPTGNGIDRNLDERIGYGIDFAFLIFTGRKLAEFEMPIRLLTAKDWDDWHSFALLIHAVPARGPVSNTTNGFTPGKALTIWHPILYPLGITQCVVRTDPLPMIQDDMGTLITIPFKQVKTAPRAAYAKPQAAAGQPPLTPEQIEIQDKTKRNALASANQVNAAAGKAPPFL